MSDKTDHIALHNTSALKKFFAGDQPLKRLSIILVATCEIQS
jgi:hypothetical protein